MKQCASKISFALVASWALVYSGVCLAETKSYSYVEVLNSSSCKVKIGTQKAKTREIGRPYPLQAGERIILPADIATVGVITDSEDAKYQVTIRQMTSDNNRAVLRAATLDETQSIVKFEVPSGW